jgi:ABC-2 type transport system permease protein
VTPTLLIARRELATFLNTTWGWVILAAVLLIDGLLFNAFAMTDAPRYSADVLEDFFFFSSGTTMIAGVLLSMRLIAEERQSGTMVLLETAPVTEAQVVLGKFLGAFGFLTVITLATVYMPILIQVNGKVGWEQIGAGYLGLLSLGGAAVAIGTFGSSLAKNQLLAAAMGGSILVLMLLGWLLARITEAPISEVLAYTALFDRHFQPFMRGRVNTESLVLYGSVIFGFLTMATRVLQTRRQA